MTDKKKALLFALLLVIILCVVTITRRGHFYTVDLYKSGDGWGYDILRNKKTYIHQPYIPAIEGEVPFSNKESARKTAKFVIRKIRDHKIPAVTREEVEDIISN